ncbi:MAG: hypothetical protein ACRBI6_07195 [Acidimicrobiales bacterium]
MQYLTVLGCLAFVWFLVIEARREQRVVRAQREELADADRRRRVATRAFFGSD